MHKWRIKANNFSKKGFRSLISNQKKPHLHQYDVIRIRHKDTAINADKCLERVDDQSDFKRFYGKILLKHSQGFTSLICFLLHHFDILSFFLNFFPSSPPRCHERARTLFLVAITCQNLRWPLLLLPRPLYVQTDTRLPRWLVLCSRVHRSFV